MKPVTSKREQAHRNAYDELGIKQGQNQGNNNVNSSAATFRNRYVQLLKTWWHAHSLLLL
jgi:hypothetical protein